MSPTGTGRSVDLMAPTPLTPVFVGLRTGLHALFVALTAVVVARAVLVPGPQSGTTVALSLLVLATYALGAVLTRRHDDLVRGRAWLGVLTLEWACLLWLSPDAAYLVFPLFFLYLHLLGRWWGPVAVGSTTVVVVVALGVHGGWTVGGVVGPFVGAGVALLIGSGYRALAHEAVEREALMTELLATRGQLAATEHESGVLAERARLAREIHDTLAQGLSSIQMLLHAAERADPGRPGLQHVRLARETAAANLADARSLVQGLTPPDLDDHGLGGVLRRLARTQWAAQDLEVTVDVPDSVSLPMHLQTALLRIAQGAVANVIQHAHARTATITLEQDHETTRFSVADDGTGFDPSDGGGARPGRSDSFGLQAARERVRQLGGALTVDSAPGRGTVLTVTLPREGEP